MTRRFAIPCLAGISLAALTACHTVEIQKADENVPLEETVLKVRPPLPVDQRKRVAVLEFEDRTDYGKGRLGRAASNILLTYLDRSQQFNIYERERIEKILEEQDLARTGAFDPATAVAVGKLAQVDLVFLGAVSNYGFHTRRTEVLIFGSKVRQQAEAVVDVRIVEVATGRIVASESGRGVVTVATGKVLGVGTSSSYDETTAGNALRAAISKYVDTLIDRSLYER